MEEAGPDVPLEPAWDWVWRAWQRLTHDRPWQGGGMGPATPGRIPWSVVARWCDVHGHGATEMEFLDLCFAALDAEFFEHWRSKLPKDAK